MLVVLVLVGGVLQMKCAVPCHLQDCGENRQALPQAKWYPYAE